MARRECSYQRMFYKVLCGLFFLKTQVIPWCLCAVEICPPCGQGEFCSAFFGLCLLCIDYCTGEDACRKKCSHNKLSTTMLPPTSTPNRTTFHPPNSTTSAEAPVLVVTFDKTHVQSGGGGPNTFLSEDYLELSEELLLTLLIILVLIMILGWLCLKHRKTVNVSIKRCFKAQDSQTSIDIELSERHSRNRRCSCETGWNIRPNPIENLTPVRPPTVTGYAVQVEDKVGTSTPAPVEADPLFQSASIHPANAPPLENERLLRAVPTDHQSGKQKTPETHRKITDGSHEGHECTTGASPFIPPNNMREDLQCYPDTGHGD